jgi:acyl-CoA reductase-like NAD-dependent aldehyde dehydrogenase
MTRVHDGVPVAPLYIAGEWRRTDRLFASTNPARPEETVCLAAAAGVDDVADAYAAAAATAPGWRRTPGPQRAAVLHRAAAILDAAGDDIGREITREEGKTLAEGVAEVARAADILRFHAGEALAARGEVHPASLHETLLYSIREPLGVVAIITPWNFPIAIPAWKIGPALAHGNTVVFKPSELTPLGAHRLVEALAAAGLPPGVCNLVHGDPAEIGEAVTGDDRVSGLSFTGSEPVGRAIQAAAAPRGVKVQLELGGKNPIIVLDDAPLDLAVELTIRGAMLSTGQKCTATSRAIVLPSVAEAYRDALDRRVRDLRCGDPQDPATDLGPLVSSPAREKVVGYLELAADEGHRLVTGGPSAVPDGGGWFVPPTVYDRVDPDSRLGTEEVFGPVVGIIPAADVETAIAVANASRYGLSASLVTRDLGAALAFAREVEAGMVHVNSETTGAEPHAPFGGVKGSSSHSREQGPAAREFYTDVKTVSIDAA